MSSSTIEARVLQVVAALHSRSVLTTIVRASVNADPSVSSREIAGSLVVRSRKSTRYARRQLGFPAAAIGPASRRP
jgi:hypothetical protein